MKTGKVFLVGAGPGDVRLITVKGLETIKQAEVILYDRLANPKLLEYAPQDCELIYCGKLPDRHTLRQENINELLVEKALEGKIVVRLKGGDPGVFGRVGEEAAALANFQIPFEIVPGISSGIAAPLYAGIPVTHREHAESFAVVTAHDKSKDGKPLLDWKGLVHCVDTIAFYMGVANLPFICENLILHGKPSSTPVILIQWGTFGRQKTLQGTLENIAAKVKEAGFTNPSIILVGDVISLREKISWFEKMPLYGRQIVFARTSEGPSSLAQALQEQGADLIEFPKWKKTTLQVDVTNITMYDHILFAAPENVTDLFTAVFQQGMDIRKIRANFYGRSSKTIKALNDRGFIGRLPVELSPSESLLIVGEDNGLKEEFKNADFLVTSKKEIDQQFVPIFKRMLGEAAINTVVFPSKASVHLFLKGLEDCEMNSIDFLKSKEIVCMGKQTLGELQDHGITSVGMTETADRAALITLLAQPLAE
nr:uroporphyrinogen-III C-methyltransferase [Neobacillus sp. Marseille-Q6967]